ncbi:MAG: BON domain-containing protein [Acidobacteriota bacterium]
MSDRIIEEREEYEPDAPLWSRQGWRRRGRYWVRRVRRPSFFSVLVGLLIAGIIAGAIYFYYYGNRSLRSDLNLVRSTSQDTATTAAVKTTFSLNKQLQDDSINVDSANGIVTLNGEVNSSQDRQLAEDLARNTRGVQRVVNNLTIAAAARTAQQVQDLELKANVLAALLANDALKGQDIRAEVKDRVVMLTGSVETELQKNIATATAQQITGVREVKDEQLSVRFQRTTEPSSQ